MLELLNYSEAIQITRLYSIRNKCSNLKFDLDQDYTMFQHIIPVVEQQIRSSILLRLRKRNVCAGPEMR